MAKAAHAIRATWMTNQMPAVSHRKDLAKNRRSERSGSSHSELTACAESKINQGLRPLPRQYALVELFSNRSAAAKLS
jgi:hypothetical protein